MGTGGDQDDDWSVACSDDELYGKDEWEPEPSEIKDLYERLAKGETLTLEWQVPERRSPHDDESGDDMEQEDEAPSEEKPEAQAPTEFDFDDDFSLQGASITPRRTPGSKTPRRTEKRVARMDKIMNDLMRHKRIDKQAKQQLQLKKQNQMTPHRPTQPQITPQQLSISPSTPKPATSIAKPTTPQPLPSIATVAAPQQLTFLKTPPPQQPPAQAESIDAQPQPLMIKPQIIAPSEPQLLPPISQIQEDIAPAQPPVKEQPAISAQPPTEAAPVTPQESAAPQTQAPLPTPAVIAPAQAQLVSPEYSEMDTTEEPDSAPQPSDETTVTTSEKADTEISSVPDTATEMQVQPAQKPSGQTQEIKPPEEVPKPPEASAETPQQVQAEQAQKEQNTPPKESEAPTEPSVKPSEPSTVPISDDPPKDNEGVNADTKETPQPMDTTPAPSSTKEEPQTPPARPAVKLTIRKDLIS